ncbi:MAG TPA: GNAT family N-acetyltransferase [Anaerolineaceae bacterium]|nr:GNAT family N-acetyltransferase [Anaerolineaceae bacterium]HQP08449.1 GNAT family N-acetyltransferase [Anaerolineaceae bacterium]
MTEKFAIQEFNLRSACEQEYQALNRISNIYQAEILPDDPPFPLEEMVRSSQSVPDFVDNFTWAAWDSALAEIIATGNVNIAKTEDNQHIAEIGIYVRQPFRRQGIGTRLLEKITRVARGENRRLLITEAIGNLSSGESFLYKIGGEKGLVGHLNQMRLDDLDHHLVETWLEWGHLNEDNFFLGLWEGLYPENQMDAILELRELENQVPVENLDIEATHLTREQVRQVENQLFARGFQRWTYYLIEKSTGKMAGYTETVWNPSRPQILYQDMTGVFPEYRNKGLGRWLKAAMIDKVLCERPEVKFIRTENADSNAAMLKINHELGFKPYISIPIWQIPLEKVEAYLAERKVLYAD